MTGFAGLLRTDDPRSNLEKARLGELLRFAKEHGVTEVRPDMPAVLIRKILRNKRITNISIPKRVLGQPERRDPIVASPEPDSVVSANAEDELMRQYNSGAMQPPMSKAPSIETTTRAELAKACKAKGIPMARTDKKEDLARKLAAHG